MTRRWKLAGISLAVVLLITFVAAALITTSNAQNEGSMQGMDHSQMDLGGRSDGATASASTEAYMAANTKMHEAMSIEFTNDTDIDFARSMIGHHQGAIDMARIMLDHGEDSELRQLAEEIIEAQEAEIAFLQNWLVENAE